MSRAVAVNVGANTNEPGFRGPVFPDGSFAYVPIPETEPTREAPPTYGDLAPVLPLAIPDDLRETPVHLDPSFAGYPRCSAYTYGDPHGVKARPLADLDAGDDVYFYATLSCARRAEDGRGAADDAFADWLTPEWGAYLIGHFRLARDPLVDPEREEVPERLRENAHYRRETFDAAVLLEGDPDGSRLYDRAVPLSGERGVDANHVVTEWSEDSGKGPWWRRPLRFDADATDSLREWVERQTYPPVR